MQYSFRTLMVGLALFALLALGWSGFRFYRAMKAEKAYEDALTREPIQQHSAELRLRGDGSFTVTEQIQLVSRAESVRHGIRRAVPLELTTPSGGRYRFSYRPSWATRNGASLPLPSPASRGKFEMLAVGRQEEPLPPGTHVFELQFDGQVTDRPNEAQPSLLWLVNNPWRMNTQNVAFLLRPAPDIDFDSLTYDGAIVKVGGDGLIHSLGSEHVAMAAAADPDEPGRRLLRARARRPLGPGEQLMIQVRWRAPLRVSAD